MNPAAFIGTRSVARLAVRLNISLRPAIYPRYPGIRISKMPPSGRKASTATPAAPSRASTRTATKRKVEYAEEDESVDESKTVAKRGRKPADETKTKKNTKVEDVDDGGGGNETAAPATKKRRTTKKGDGEGDKSVAPLAERTVVSLLKKEMYIGAHVSASGGVHNSIPNALHIGANALALFLKSQRRWSSPPLDPAAKSSFRTLSAQHGYSPTKHMLPHGSYLVNLAQPDATKAATAYASFVDDLRRCAQLGIRLYNFHPGSAVDGSTKDEAVRRIAAQLNRAHKETAGDAVVRDEDGDGAEGGVVTVLENMAGSGNVVGSRFEELRDIIALVEDKDRVGVCIDTCHAFAAGYDLRTQEAFDRTMREFDDVVGLKYLKALHLNDSKAPLGSNRDLHANIGTGFLGLLAFHAVVNFAPFSNKPMVLETPLDRPGPDGKTIEDHRVWADEIKLLEGLVGADPDTEEFRATAERLQDEGRAERERVAAQVEKKKKGGTKKGRARKEECDSCDEGDAK